MTRKVYAPHSGVYLADTAAKPGRYLGPQLTRAVPAVPPLNTPRETPRNKNPAMKRGLEWS